MINFLKQLIKKAYNQIGLDIIKSPSKNSLLGLKNLSIRTVIDVGANEGQFARKLSTFFPNAYIYCFEPLPNSFEKLSKWADNQKGRVKVFNTALGDSEGTVEMFSHVNHSPSSSLLRTTETCERLYPFTKKQTNVSVKLTTLDKVMTNLSELLIPDILIKLDVQGYEDRVIRGGVETFRKAKACILEVGLDKLYENQATFKDILYLLNELGFHYVGNLEQVYADDGHVIFINAVFVNMATMDNNFTDRQKDLLGILSAATQWSKRKRVVRIITHPWKMLYPKFMKITKRSKEVKVRTFWGGEINLILPEEVSTNIWRYSFFEENVCLFMLNSLKEGMTFIDIGAHYGFFTLLGSYLVGKEGKVLAFEPTPTTYQQLLKNVTNHSEYPNVETYDCAAYSENTEIKFYDYGLEKSAYNSIFGLRKTDSSLNRKNEIVVKARKIDDLLKEKEIKSVNFIKIDAESSEIHVLNGMIETLMNFKPNIIIELGDFAIHEIPKSKEIIILLQQMNYLPYEVRNGKIVQHIIKEQYEYSNLLFIAE